MRHMPPLPAAMAVRMVTGRIALLPHREPALMAEAKNDQLEEILALLAEATDRLDRALGIATKLGRARGKLRQVVRARVVPPRTHLQESIMGLRRDLEEIRAQASARKPD